MNGPVSRIVKHLVGLSAGRLLRIQFNRAAGIFFIAFIFTNHNNKKGKVGVHSIELMLSEFY